MKKFNSQTEAFTLTNQNIDLISIRTDKALKDLGLEKGNIIRLRLSVEDALLFWKKQLGEDTECKFEAGTRLGKTYIRLSAVGITADPYKESDEIYFSSSGIRNLMSQLGVGAVFEYHNGVNELTITPPKKRKNQLILILAIAMLAIITGIILKNFFPDSCASFSEKIITPIFNTILSIFTAVSGPLIFLALCTGIFGIGDVALLGKISKQTVFRFIIDTLLILVVITLSIIWFFPLSLSQSASGSSDTWNKLLEMLLNIIPKNIFSPFIEGNALQIIFLAVVFGITLLILGRKVNEFTKGIEQLYTISQQLMSFVVKLVPIFVFLCLLNLSISGMQFDMKCIGKLIVMIVLSLLLMISVHVILLCLKYKLHIKTVIKKLLPTFLIGLTTASSIATFSTNCDTCIQLFGINKKLVNFGIPIGQVIFKPSTACGFLISSLCVSELYGITITPVWILTSVLVAGILSIAAPPISGGALSCYSIIFTQLGIPTEGIAIAIGFDVIFDYFSTATNILCLQAELTLFADNLDMIDRDTLKK